jgi:hypothetical protein
MREKALRQQMHYSLTSHCGSKIYVQETKKKLYCSFNHLEKISGFKAILKLNVNLLVLGNHFMLQVPVQPATELGNNYIAVTE